MPDWQPRKLPRQARSRASYDAILGGWCFSDGAHRWPVSDCAAEAVSALLALDDAPAPDRIARERLQQAATFILARREGRWVCVHSHVSLQPTQSEAAHGKLGTA